MAIRVISFSGYVAQNLVSSAGANSRSVQQCRILSRFFGAAQKSDLNRSRGVRNFYSDHRRPKSNSCIKNSAHSSAYSTLAAEELLGENWKNPIIQEFNKSNSCIKNSAHSSAYSTSSIIPFFQGSKWLRVLTEKVPFFKEHSWLQVPCGKLFSLAYEMSPMVMFTLLRKQFRGRMKGTAYQDNHICFGKYALQALEPAWITSRQIEAGRRAISRNVHRGGQIWVRIFPHKPVTAKPVETRMGKGKGSQEYLVAVVKPGKILYEVSGVSETIARKAISIAASKMPIQTQFILSQERGPLV